MFKHIIAAAILALALSSPAWACQTYTYIINGRFVVCTACGGFTSCN